MAKDRLLFLLSFAFIGIVAAMLFSRSDKPPPPEEAPAPEKVEEPKPEEVIKPPALPTEPGKIALPFQLTTRSAIVQFLNLGTFVQVIFTSNSDIGFGSITLPLLSNIRILDIGKTAEGQAFNEKGVIFKPNTPIEILLEVTPRQAEILSYAEQSGTVTIGIEGSSPLQGNDELVEKLLESDSSDGFQSILVTYMLNSLFPDKSDVKVMATGKGYIVSGKVKDQQTNEKIIQILNMLTSDGNKSVVNLIEEYSKSIQVLAANNDLKANMTLKPEDYQWITIDPNDLNPSMIVKDPQIEKWVNEFIIAKNISKGQFIKRHDIIWEQELSALSKKPESLPLAPCKTAVLFELNPRSPITSFIKPGLRVDVRFTSAPEISISQISLTLFKDIRILSVRKSHEPIFNEDHPPLPPSDRPIELFLEMTPRQAEIFTYALESGNIILELSDCDSCDDSKELMGYSRPFGEADELTEMLLTSESYGDFRSFLITHMIRSIFPTVCIKVTATPQGFIVEGKVPDPQMADKIFEIMVKLVPGGDRAIINLLDIEPQQVLLRVKVFEVVKDVTSRVGVNWDVLYDHNHQVFGLSSVFPVEAAPNYLFRAAGQFGRYTLTALLDMLQQNNYAKVLAEPNLTTIAGETAHFFSGGEFPILIPQGGGILGLTTVVVVFKKYGVLLDFTPFVDLNGLITLHVVPEVSSLDKANAVVLSGFIIPSLISRRADTTVKLWPGQSYVIAGLYLDESLNRNNNLYGLNKIPLIGALFTSNHYRERRTELLIVVTPYLVSNNDLARSGIKASSSCEITSCDLKRENTFDCNQMTWEEYQNNCNCNH